MSSLKRNPLAALALVALGVAVGLTLQGAPGNTTATAAPMAAAAAAAPAAPAGELRSYADVAALTMPAVVNIATDKAVDASFQHPFMEDPMFRRFFNMPDDENHRGQERVERSMGSGIVISQDGYILTNNHVVENATKIKVTFEGEREYEAKVIGTDPPTDVALLKIEAKGLPMIEVADSAKLRVGDQVMAIGNPFGVGQTITMGIVSAMGRNIGLTAYADFIQTDASINPGNSGGALVNMEGKLVGMNSAILSRSGGSMGIGFAIPSSMAMKVVEALKSDGEVKRAYLGVMPQEVDQSLADYYGLDKPQGVLVAQVNDDTPAAAAGLKEGDIILSVDGKPINSPNALRNLISLSDIGHAARVQVLRDGKERDVTVKLGRLPDAEVAANAPAARPDARDEDKTLAGVTVRPLTDRARAATRLPDSVNGLLVTAVASTSNAAGEGLEEGDIIVEVNRAPVTTLAEFQSALARTPERPVFMRVYKPRAQQSVFLAVPR
ncbi:MAG: DegQ family serine endoprotease [bacterium]|nr:DegQ family serine endoprotease [bacterium]